MSALPNGYKTLKTYWSDFLGCLEVIIIFFFLNSMIKYEFIFFFDADRHYSFTHKAFIVYDGGEGGVR